ncbi:putative Zinc finger, BED-type [Corchorus capsularis]|uniref:Putative Zinc finger, BED-type n=1 Tax=Corchorus capsularis TaxID=210143 RepID=A0A1R3JT14_COCAP|nr:putative Zinc finger, BED-type [Corchorus capsularis]
MAGRRRDPAWEYGDLFPGKGQHVVCKFCGHVMWGIKRLKEHLAAKPGHVRKCEECPPDVRREMRERLMMFHTEEEHAEGLRARRLSLGREVGESSSTQTKTPAEIEDDEINQAIHKSLETFNEEQKCRNLLKEFGPNQDDPVANMSEEEFEKYLEENFPDNPLEKDFPEYFDDDVDFCDGDAADDE